MPITVTVPVQESRLDYSRKAEAAFTRGPVLSAASGPCAAARTPGAPRTDSPPPARSDEGDDPPRVGCCGRGGNQVVTGSGPLPLQPPPDPPELFPSPLVVRHHRAAAAPPQIPWPRWTDATRPAEYGLSPRASRADLRSHQPQRNQADPRNDDPPGSAACGRGGDRLVTAAPRILFPSAPS